MSPKPFTPTSEQARIVKHEGCAFVSACPGAGKTRILVERARVVLKDRSRGRGIAFLSFTNSAVSELERRLRQECLLSSPALPHFMGTFDSFLWQFLVAPFGVPACKESPRFISDKNQITVCPYAKGHRLPLSCFDRVTGHVIPAEARRFRFDPDKNPNLTKAYVTTAASIRKRCLERGEVDFDDVRAIAAARLEDAALSARLAIALSARFGEVIVDEAQDCNPADLEIIQWLRNAGIATKVVCDPHQSIYAFRGGVTEELLSFGERFDEQDRLLMSGNFRSSDTICRAVGALRPAHTRALPDRALGEHSASTTPVHILAYPGNGVPSTVGAAFRELLAAEVVDSACCPVVASTWDSAASAIGQPTKAGRRDLTLRLAAAVSTFHVDFDTGSRREALDEVHRVILELEGRLDARTYHQCLSGDGIETEAWRPRILKLVRDLRYDPATFPTPDAWHSRAKTLLEKHLPAGSQSIARRLPRNAGLAAILGVSRASNLSARSIHSVKGMEFPAVCVVMTVRTARGILDYLQTGAPADRSEDARKIYVAASRAQRLLAIAIPKSQAGRLADLLRATGTALAVSNL